MRTCQKMQQSWELIASSNIYLNNSWMEEVSTYKFQMLVNLLVETGLLLSSSINTLTETPEQF